MLFSSHYCCENKNIFLKYSFFIYFNFPVKSNVYNMFKNMNLKVENKHAFGKFRTTSASESKEGIHVTCLSFWFSTLYPVIYRIS